MIYIVTISQGIIQSHYEHVWLYGSNPQNQKLWEQDGVAPQEDHSDIIGTNNRRYIEDDGIEEHLNFLDAHSATSYEFIFGYDINEKAGYVYPRK